MSTVDVGRMTDDGVQQLSQEGAVLLRRIQRRDIDAGSTSSGTVLAASQSSSDNTQDRLAHEYELAKYLDSNWAVKPRELVHEDGQIVLILDDPGGELLSRYHGAAMELGRFLTIALGIATSVRKMHQQGLIHKDIKPANILVDSHDGVIRLTGFGIASRIPRERQPPEPPELVSGTLAYMAPEQTGRMNRSIDSRSDLYALGVTLYELLTGHLPFSAGDAIEWIHCHIARRPPPPADWRPGVPPAIAAILMKLLEKAAEDRYQTAAGLEHDLQRCLAEWERRHQIDPFPLGEQDIPDRLLIPEKLYGREQDIGTLLDAFDSVLSNGVPELVLVSGYSGIGKSAAVNELHKVLVLPRGLFASGKFDQYKRDIPYATLAQAFQSLIRQLLVRPEAELAEWRNDLHAALGPNGQLIVELVPELKLIIGDQPNVPELPPQQAKARFQLVLRSFIGVFARPEHPLALFLDDLQWLDAATLDLVESLLVEPELRYLLLIGAYRDNEVDSTHPLIRKLDLIRRDGAKTRLVTLGPLERADLTQLIMDSLHCDHGRAAPLAKMVHEKTAGNPFFALQFISTLVDEGLLAFDHANAQWQWDSCRIDAKGYTDNVVDLMVGKLQRLPTETLEALQLLACLGTSAQLAFLSMIQGKSEEEIHAAFWEARRAELVVRSEASYTFAHDRVQEAAYSLISADRRAKTHLRLGRLFIAHTAPDKREDLIFEIVAQFERGTALIDSRDEREQLAELNLMAGRRAKASAAYTSALKYAVAGTMLLTDDCWTRRHDLVFQLELQRAECEFLTGDLAAADQRLTLLANRAATSTERSAVACLRVDLCTALDRPDQAVAVCLDYLRTFGIEWSPHPTSEETRLEYEQVWSNLRGRTTDELIDLPLMSDPDSLAVLDVLTKVAAPAIFTDANLFALVIYRIVNLSLQNGNSDGSCFAYVSFALTPNVRFGDARRGFQFGNLGYALVEKRGLVRFQARTYLAYGKLVPWMQHVRASYDIANRTIDAALKVGDLTYATYSLNLRNAYRLAAGDPLAEVQRDAEGGITFERRAGVGLSVVAVATQLSLIRTLRGLSPTFGSLDGLEFDEASFERQLASDPSMASSECWYWVRKLQARCIAGDHVAAVEAAARAEALLWSSAAFFEEAEYHFYAALSHAACCSSASARQREHHLKALAVHHRQLAAWAEDCPANFANRADMVQAELARIEGRELEAMRLYERAIAAARAERFVNNEAIANELAARFYAARGFDTIARAYFREARSCYQRWGADGKVRQLDAQHPWLHESELVRAADTIATRPEHLDFTTVVKVSQTLSGEMVLDRLIDALMRLAIEYAGAERGVLLLARGSEFHREAEAVIAGSGITVHRPAELTTGIPDTIIHYVLRTHEIAIVDDASAHPIYCADAYVLERKVKSVLCLPLINESKVTGVLYLENNLARRVFTPNRLAVLKLLALQASISLENTYLYTHLAQAEQALSISERNLQLTIDTIPAMVWSTLADGSVEFVNAHYCNYVGLRHEQFLEWGWTVAVHPDDIERLKQVWFELVAAGTPGEAEARFRRADGEYRWFLTRASPLRDGNGNIVRWYGVNTDIEDRKRAEIHLTSEKQILEMIASRRPLREVLIALCRFFEGLAPDCYCGVYPMDASGRVFQYGVAPSLPRSYTDPIEAALVGSDDSPRGRSASQGTQIIAEDIGSDVRWTAAPCRAHVLRYGLRAVWSTPIFSRQGAVIGCLCVYRRTAGRPSEHHQEAISHVAHLASIAIERSQAEAALRRSETFLTEGQRISSTGSFLWTLDTDEITFSDELRRIFEFGAGVSITLDMVSQRVHPDDLAIFAEMRGQIHLGEDNPDYDIRLQMPDGRIKYIRVFARIIKHEDGRLERLGAVQDVTRRRMIEEAHDKLRSELAHASRVVSLGALTASIAHEVNQPLASIVTNGETGLRWLNRPDANLAKVEVCIQRVVDDARRAARIIDRIRGMASRGATKRSEVALAEIVREATAFLHHEFQVRNVQVLLELEPDLPHVMGDRTQLQQVIVNLVMNAVQALTKADASEKKIAIRTQQIGGQKVRCIVEDSGPGIEPIHLPHLFESLFTTNEAGMGLGLPIAQSILEAHGGRIRADNGSALGGARFDFELPIVSP